MAKALDDIRIIDLTRVIAGPFATTLLADMGATVIKIELPGRGDDARYGYPAVEGVAVAFLALNRNKKGITLDIRKPQGAELFRKLAAHADVVMENFAAGTMEMRVLGPEGANVPCAPVMTLDRLLADPHLRAREMVVELPHQKLGKIPVPGVPFKLSASPGKVEHLGPELGQHNAEIYGGLLGLSAHEISKTQAEGVI